MRKSLYVRAPLVFESRRVCTSSPSCEYSFARYSRALVWSRMSLPRKRGVIDAAMSPFVMGIAKDGQGGGREDRERYETI
jgi:hypothetical protein